MSSSLPPKSNMFLILLKNLRNASFHPKRIIRYANKKRLEFIRVQLNSLWSKQDYILSNIDSTTNEVLLANQNITEFEHQVGRYKNMKKIGVEMIKDKIAGDIVEFGTWQGLGLILLSKCFLGDTIKRNIIGIDSFEGLPESSTIWRKGSFNNTSLDLVKKNILEKIMPSEQLSLELIKGWFNDIEVKRRLYAQCKEIALVHFDADLGSSTTQALALIEPFLLKRKQPMYFLFDDWGCHPDEVPEAFLHWLSTAQSKYHLKAQRLSSTRFTRYYKITFHQERRKWTSLKNPGAKKKSSK